MKENMIASPDKLSSTDFLDFGKNQDLDPKENNDIKYLESEPKVFRRDDQWEFRKQQEINMGESGLNQVLRLRNQIVVNAGDFEKDENLQPFVTSRYQEI